MSRVLVTGGAGFIGSHVVPALLAEGHAVTVFDDLSVGRAEAVPAGATLVRGDVGDTAALEAAMAGHERVLHLAARVAIRSSFEFAVEDTRVNVVGTASLLRAAQRCGVTRVVAASSMAVYADGEAGIPVPEAHPARPISPYGISKLAMEQLVHAMCAAAGQQSLVLRFFNTYGPGQALSPYVGVTTIFTHALRRGEVPRIFGDGEQCRDFVHAADVAQACVRALASERSGLTLNVGTGQGTTVNRLYELVQAALGTDIAPLRLPAVAGELRHSVADISAIRAALGYAPRHRLDDELAAVVQEVARAATPGG